MGRILGGLGIFLLVFVVGMALTAGWTGPGGSGTGTLAHIDIDSDSDSDSDNDNDSGAVPVRPVEYLRPGLWAVRRSTKIIDMPGASPNELSEAQQRLGWVFNNQKCLIDGGKTDIFEGAVSRFDGCRVKGVPRPDGRVIGDVMCRPGFAPARRVGTVSGHQEGRSFDVAIDMTGNVGRAGPAQVRINIEGRHLSDDCGPDYRKDQGPDNLPVINP